MEMNAPLPNKSIFVLLAVWTWNNGSTEKIQGSSGFLQHGSVLSGDNVREAARPKVNVRHGRVLQQHEPLFIEVHRCSLSEISVYCKQSI